MGILALWFSIKIKNTSTVLIRLWHIFGLLVSSAGVGLILSTVPRGISTNAGLSPLDLALAKIPFLWFAALLMPVVWTIHLWGLVHIGKKISKTV
ncbi:MAG: hypothetical protein R3B47_09190 [Bacteroidia bacterium]